MGVNSVVFQASALAKSVAVIGGEKFGVAVAKEQ